MTSISESTRLTGLVAGIIQGMQKGNAPFSPATPKAST